MAWPLRTSLGAVLATLLAQPAAAQGPITITDMENREVRLARPAERVASIPIPMASTVIALDGSPRRLVGVHPLARSAFDEGILGRIFPQARQIPADIVGANFVPNVEALAARRPDLVIQWGGRGREIVDPIINARLSTMLILYGTEARAQRYMRDVATAIGRPERIGPLVEWRDQVAGRLRAVVEAVPPMQRPRVLYLQRALSGMLAAGSDPEVYNHFVIELAGGRNAAEGLRGFTPVNAEQVAAWDPEVILLNSFEDALTTGFVYDHPILSLTRAARSRRVYKMPLGGYRWDPPSQESPLAWMWLATLLQPDRVTFDLRVEMREAYRLLYGHDLTPAETDEILRIATQGDATNYARFRAR
jgi:iron complex transport system substrate-binding protein